MVEIGPDHPYYAAWRRGAIPVPPSTPPREAANGEPMAPPTTPLDVLPWDRSVPNPGSPDAVRRGCTCPIEDNQHGLGSDPAFGDGFEVAVNCPLHGPGRSPHTR